MLRVEELSLNLYTYIDLDRTKYCTNVYICLVYIDDRYTYATLTYLQKIYI